MLLAFADAYGDCVRQASHHVLAQKPLFFLGIGDHARFNQDGGACSSFKHDQVVITMNAVRLVDQGAVFPGNGGRVVQRWGVARCGQRPPHQSAATMTNP